MPEWSRYDTYPQLGGLERVRARFRSHAFARHSHDYYAIGIIRHGVQSFEYGKRHYVTPNGAMCIINPGEMHTGQAETDDGFDYHAIYPSADLMRSIAAEIHGCEAGLPWFDTAVVTDLHVITPVLQLHNVLDTPTSALEQETYLLSALVTLVSRHSSPRQSAMSNATHRSAALQIRDYLEEFYSENITLNELARIVSLSPWHAARVFREAYHMPPHAYLDGVRIRHARILVRQGHGLAEAALATGFVDQSHFTRRFKRHLGVTPGQYAQNHKNVQDSARTS